MIYVGVGGIILRQFRYSEPTAIFLATCENKIKCSVWFKMSTQTLNWDVCNIH